MNRVWLYLFLIAGAGEIASRVTDLPMIHWICKPALLFFLGLYYFTSQRSSGQWSPLLMLALFFAWLGDIILMVEGELYFMLGLVSFLTAHIIYIFVFKQHRGQDNENTLQGLRRVRFAFPIILAGTGLITILYPHLDGLRIPVMIYALVITLMALNALFRFARTSTKSFSMVFGGAILFMMSDSILAIDKFIEPVSYGGFWIMTTYISAQFLIVQGLMVHKE